MHPVEAEEVETRPIGDTASLPRPPARVEHGHVHPPVVVGVAGGPDHGADVLAIEVDRVDVLDVGDRPGDRVVRIRGVDAELFLRKLAHQCHEADVRLIRGIQNIIHVRVENDGAIGDPIDSTDDLDTRSCESADV